jgi:MFS family permease
LAIAVFSPFGGWLIDRMGTKKPFVAGLLIYGAAGGTGFFVSSFITLLISRIVVGLGVALFYNAITVMILNLYSSIERDRVMGFRASANSAGGIAWPLVGGALGSLTWQHPFLIYTLGILLGLTALFSIPDTHAVPDAGQSTRTPSAEIGTASLLKKEPIFFLIYLSVLVTYLLLYAFVLYLPMLLASVDISKPFIISIYISVLSAAAGITALLYGKARSALSHQAIITIAFGCMVLGFLSFALFHVPLFWMIGLILYGAGFGFAIPCLMVWTGEIAPGPVRGRMTSYIGLSGFLGQFLAPLLFGPVMSRFGMYSIYYLGAGLPFLLIIAFLLVPKKAS